MLYNTFTLNKEARIWFYFLPDGVDLEIEECGEDIGTRPEWIEFETDHMSWQDIILHGCGLSSYVRSMTYFALTHGIAPKQAFLVHFKEPEFQTHCTDYGADSDMEYDCEIVQIEPLARKLALRRWSRELKEVLADRAKMAENQAILETKQKSEIESMYIRFDSYYTQGYYEMSPPDGSIVSLCTKRTGLGNPPYPYSLNHVLVSGRAPRQEDAWKDLVKNVKAFLPKLTEKRLRKLPTVY